MTHLNNEIALTLKIEGEAFTSWDGIDEAITNRIADLLMSDHTLDLRNRLNETINAAITARLEETVAAYLSRPIKPVDRFGSPIEGEPTRTLSDLIAEAADEALSQTVDTFGKPARIGSSRMEWLVKKIAREGVATATESAIRNVNANARASIQAQVAESISMYLSKGGRNA